MLPNSLTKVLPFAWVFSTRLPVSVCGTVYQVSSLRGFSRQQGSTTYASGARSRVSARSAFSLQTSTPTHFHLHNQSQAGLPRCVPTSLFPIGSGMLTGCPSPTPRGLGLGPTNPTRTDLPSETLDLRRTRFSRVFRYSCLHSHFCPLQSSFRSTFSAGRTLPY